MDNDLLHTAIHEAGHAVVGRVLDLSCGHATIVPDGDSAGHVITRPPLGGTLERWWDVCGIFHRGEDAAFRGSVIALMAGRLAEEECLGFCHGGDREDRNQIDLILDSMLPEDANVPAYYRRLERFGRAIVHRHRSTIEHVAELLLAHKHLDAKAIDAEMRRPRKPRR